MTAITANFPAGGKILGVSLSTKDEARLEFLRHAKPGSWLAVSEDGYELWGHGDTPEEALEQARKKGHDDPVLTMVPPKKQLAFST
jgi:hypothetical protein